MFSVKIFAIHSWQYISWKWTCLIEIWITWFQKNLAIPHFQIPHMKSQKELWKPDLNLVSQGCQHEKILKFTYRIRTRTPAKTVTILTLDHQSQLHRDPTKLLMLRSQLREQICQTSKSDWQEWVLGSSEWNYYWNMEIFGICFDGPVTKYLLLMQGSWIQIQGVKFFSWWHPWEPRFKSGFHNSFWDLVVPDRISWMTLEI